MGTTMATERVVVEIPMSILGWRTDSEYAYDDAVVGERTAAGYVPYTLSCGRTVLARPGDQETVVRVVPKSVDDLRALLAAYPKRIDY